MDPNMPNPLDVYTTITLTKEELKQKQVIDVPRGNSYVRVQLPEKVVSGNTYGYVGQGNKDANGNRGTLYLTIQIKGGAKSAKTWIIAVVAVVAIALVAAAALFGGELLEDFSIKDFFSSKDTDTVIETIEPDEDSEAEESEPEEPEDETKETSAAPAPETEATEPETQVPETEMTEPATEATVPATEIATEPETEAPCEHKWKNATYLDPETCELCGETKGTAKQLEVGDSLYFGTYVQEIGKDAQPIEWIVVDKQADRALLLSRYCLDAKPIMEGGTTATWELSTLRGWLNNSFLNDSFTSSQRSSILEVTNKNADNAIYGTDGGADTRDRVFLLSLDEYSYYLSGSSLMEKLGGPTGYAMQNGAASLNDEGNAFWWLRTPGKTQKTGTVVGCSDGKIYSEDVVSCLDDTVRPAVWVDLHTLG